jgi:hypothetical protein
MIYYLVSRRHRYTMAEYLASWGKEIAERVTVMPYGALPTNRDLPRGTYVLSDLDRLNPLQLRVVTSVCRQLEDAGVRLLNHPERSLGRAALLDLLAARGDNRYRAHSLSAPGQPWRYPVFVRQENEHNGSLSKLIHDEASLREVLFVLTMEGYRPEELLVIEFCDTADADGIYRKLSAFLVGDQVIPRHVLFSKNWMLKDLDLLEPAHREEIRGYVAANPHERELRELFAAAGIQYGRIDYAFLGGAIQVWEINTNPIVARPPEKYPEFAHAFHQAFATRFNEAIAAIDSPSTGPRIPIRWDVPAVLA